MSRKYYSVEVSLKVAFFVDGEADDVAIRDTVVQELSEEVHDVDFMKLYDFEPPPWKEITRREAHEIGLAHEER